MASTRSDANTKIPGRRYTVVLRRWYLSVASLWSPTKFGGTAFALLKPSTWRRQPTCWLFPGVNTTGSISYD